MMVKDEESKSDASGNERKETRVLLSLYILTTHPLRRTCLTRGAHHCLSEHFLPESGLLEP